LALGVNTQGAVARAGMEAGAKAYSQEFESEADYLALYMLARAGFDINVAPDLFRRMGVQKPSGQIKTYFSTHPSTPERAVAMTQTISEIEGKLSQRQALLPKTLEGQVLAVNSPAQGVPPVITAAAPTPVQVAPPSEAQTINSPALAFAPAGQSGPPAAVVSITPPPTASRLLAQLYLIKGRVVTNPPQTFSAEFLETGKAAVTLAGPRRVTGDFELFGLTESIDAKYKPRLIKPDNLKPFTGADAKGFATFADAELRIECAYALIRSTGRGEGACADNQGNIYRIVF
jgi:predicted Zn-dependent protease